MAGIIEVKDQGKLRIYDADNSHYVDIVVPSSVTANRTITIPDASFTVPQADTNTVGLTGVSTASGNVTITDGNLTFGGAGHGVHLGVTSATAANLLDDYEEGTWEATIACGSGTVTLASSGNLCTYTKIGRTVQLNGSVTVSAISSPSGDLLINGMPFATGSGEGGERATGAFCLYSPANGTPPGLVAQMFGGYASIRIESSGGADRSQADHVQVGSELRFTTNYQI